MNLSGFFTDKNGNPLRITLSGGKSITGVLIGADDKFVFLRTQSGQQAAIALSAIVLAQEICAKSMETPALENEYKVHGCDCTCSLCVDKRCREHYGESSPICGELRNNAGLAKKLCGDCGKSS